MLADYENTSIVMFRIINSDLLKQKAFSEQKAFFVRAFSGY